MRIDKNWLKKMKVVKQETATFYNCCLDIRREIDWTSHWSENGANRLSLYFFYSARSPLDCEFKEKTCTQWRSSSKRIIDLRYRRKWKIVGISHTYSTVPNRFLVIICGLKSYKCFLLRKFNTRHFLFSLWNTHHLIT